MQVQQGQRKNPPVGQNLPQWNWEEGEGWGQGISTGTGWSDSDSASHQSDGQEIGMWNMNSSHRGFTSAASSSGNSDSKACDSHDKDPWPTDTDNAPAKSGSVISSSSNPGQGQGSVAVSRGPNTITSSASSMWGSSFATTSNSHAWDANTGGASGVWGNTPSAMSSSGGSEHDLFMQGDQAHSGGGGGDNASNAPPYTSSGDTKSLGWANISQNSLLSQQQQQQQPPQSSANTSDTSTTPVSGAVHVSGAHTGADGGSTGGAQQQPVGSGSSGAAWQGTQTSTAAATLADSSWGGVSAGNTVISSSLGGLSESSPDISNKGQPMLQRSGSMNQWECGSDGAGSWGEKERKQSEKGSGWGSPPSPLPNSGTEEWSRPGGDGKSQNWGGQAPGGQPPSGWVPPPDTKSNPAGWGGQVEMPGVRGWGDADPAKSNSAGWGGSDVEMPRQPWGDKPPPPVQQMPWDVPVGPGGNANPSSEWGSSQPTTSMSTPATWGNSPMATAGSSRPVGSQPPPPPPMQQQQQPGAPGTWAQAAGRGLPPTSDTTRPPPAVVPANMPNTSTAAAGVNTGSRISKEDLIAQVVNSSEGWGKVPVRQDTAWNVDNSKQHIPPHKVVATGVGMGPDEDANHWHQPNNGTAIWEATKESTGMPPPPPPQQQRWNSGHASGAGPDVDPNTWNGPPSQQPNMYPQSKPCPSNWQGPPGGNNWNSGAVNAPPMHNWSGSGASSSSSGSWEGNVKSEWGGEKKDDSVFNRDGTLMWGEHGGAKPGEVPSWGSHQQSMSGRSSTSGDGDSGEGWGGGGPEPPADIVDDGTTFWGEPNTHQRPTSWNGPDGPPGPRPISGKMDDKGPPMWNQPPPPHVLHRPYSYGDTGEGRPMPSPMNDAFWGPGQQPKPGNWGDPSWMNIPKQHKGPSSWGDGGPDPHHWNMKRFPLQMNANFGSVNRQQQQPQMRSRLIQQLMDMGFKKEDAQNALIRNNMNLESAIADLVASAAASRRQDMDFSDMGPKIRQVRGMGSDSMGDIHMDNGGGHIMPPNTPFSNAQTQFINSQAFVNSHKQQQGPASLQTSSSLIVGGANSSINNPAVAMQQKLLQQQLAKKHQQPPPMPAQGQPIRGGGGGGGSGGGGGGGGQLSATTVQHLQQQQAQQQQQIVQQLHMAVTAGLISPQLLNQQMTPTMLVMLQQLLQLQQMLQQLVSRQQMQQTGKMQSRQQLDLTIQEIQQQILRQQQQIAAAQQQQQQCLHQSVKQPPPMPPAPGDPLAKDMPGLDIASMNLKDLTALPVQQQARSRLTQWKLPSPEKDVVAQPGGDVTLNKVVGGKPLQQSHSTPNLQTKFESNLPFFDNTWSNNLSSTSMWPTTSAMQSVAACSTSQAGELTDSTASSTSKESLVAGMPSVAAATVATSDVTSSTASGTTSPCSESPTSGESLDIVEFFPGKKWQGVEAKTIEDDPHMTPGSVSRSLSINTIKDDYIMSMLGKQESNSPSPAWPSFGMVNNPRSKSSSSMWQPSPTDPTAVSLSSDPWGSQPPQQAPTVPKNTRPPPGLAPASKTGSSTWQHQQFNRSQSWTPGERSLTTMGSASVGGAGGPDWGSPQSPTNWLVLKNLTPQIDGSTLKTLCMQHGPLQVFYLNQGMALVCYNTRQEAVKAQSALNSCILNNTTILAECISEPEIKQLLAQTPAGSAAGGGSTPSSSLWPQSTASHAPASTNSFRTLAMPTNPTSKVSESGQWNGTTNLASVWSGDGLWAPREDDHTC